MSNFKKPVSSQATEYLHRPEFLAPFVGAGFNIYEPAWDTGVDFILLKEFSKEYEKPDIVIKVQLKSRWRIEKKYLGRNIWIAFPEHPLDQDQNNLHHLARAWYLMPHDLMVLQAAADHGQSKSFQDGHYSKKNVPKDFIEKNERFSVTKLILHLDASCEVSSFEPKPLKIWPIQE